MSVVVVGAGLAGLTAAARISERGTAVTLIHFGVGGLQLGTGCLDVLGYAPERVVSWSEALPDFIAEHPEHPYSVLGIDGVQAGVGYAAELFDGRLVLADGNWWLPTPVGGVRPTALAAASMVAGDVSTRSSSSLNERGLGSSSLDDGRSPSGGDEPRSPSEGDEPRSPSERSESRSVLVAGPRQLKDFMPELVAGNLARVAGLNTRPLSFDFEPRPRDVDANALVYARAFDDPATLRRLADTLRPHCRGVDVVYLPAFLGLRTDGTRALSELLGTPVAEVPLVPPSVPGMRLNQHLLDLLAARGVRMIKGARVTGVETEGNHVTGVVAATTGHPTTVAADAVVYAPGGFESGALELDSRGVVAETHLGLPVRVPDGDLVVEDRAQPQPLFAAGVAVDAAMRALDAVGHPVYDNLYAVGGLVAGAQRWRELSSDGIAVATAVRAADSTKEWA